MNVMSSERRDGRLVVWVSENADRVLLRQAAERVEQEIGAVACERFDGGDRVFWDFTLMDTPLTLLLEERRLAVLAGNVSTAAEGLARRVAEHLGARLDG